MADFNKIFVDSPITLNSYESSTLCFSDGKSLSRSSYSIEDDVFKLSLDALESISAYYGYNIASVYEFRSTLVNYNTIISGVDAYGQRMKNIPKDKTYLMVFVNGELLGQDKFEILDDAIQVFVNCDPTQQNIIQIYVSNSSGNPIYRGRLPLTIEPDGKVAGAQTYNIAYNKDTTLFFVNGILVPFSQILEISFRGDVTCTISYPFEKDDVLEYYVLNNNSLSLHFNASPGYTEYFDRDYFNHKISTIYNGAVIFNSAASLLIDNIRPGFFLKEAEGSGCLMLVGSDFDASTVFCEVLSPFTKSSYEVGEYYAEVPDCRSIVEYLSDFDKNYKLLPEVLSVLQNVILKEVYDEALRLKNMRSVTRVDAAYINKFIRFLGFDMDIKRLPLRKRREILEELNSYYRVVGTKNACNYFNMIESNWGVKSVEQLFTYHNSLLPNQKEYIDFVLMRETGAYEEHIEYQYPYIDYGKINDIVAETLDYGPAIDAEVAEEEGIEVVGEDYGWVFTPIKGKWVKWWKFDRPKNLYPTNHVVVDVDMKVGEEATNLLDEFKNKFYNLVSTVLYIHKIIESYTIGKETSAPEPGNIAQVAKMPHFGIMYTTPKVTQTCTVGNHFDITNGRLQEIREENVVEPVEIEE